MGKPSPFLIRLFAIACSISLAACSGHRISKLEPKFADIRSIQARQTSEISNLRDDQQKIYGQLQEIEYAIIDQIRALKEEIRLLEGRIPPPEIVPVNLLAQDEASVISLEGEEAEKFAQALIFLRKGNFENAAAILNNFITLNPNTTITDNALFWLGISNLAMKDHNRAIVAFSDVFQKFPAEDMADNSLFYLSKTFVAQNSREDAKIAIEKLITDYPNSIHLAEAKRTLSELGRQ